MAFLMAMIVTANLIGFIGSLILTFGIPFLIFFMNRKKIKKQGIAGIYDSYSEFKLGGSIDKVVYADIKTYQVERFNGTHLKIKFKDGHNFKLQANSNFCNIEAFDIFCQQFENMVQLYKTSNNIELIRKPSMFEQAWMLPFLIVFTVVMIGAIVFVISGGKSIPPTFYTSAAIIIPMWIAYLNVKKRKQG
jgi:hypothetical protein